ncbi:MAG: prepilin peptidase [Lachnospiraceae bacterium]|nr:prepilin peptidase [Lachnospiraceae bacterium]
MKEAALFIFLIISTVFDIKSRTVPAVIFAISGAVGIMAYIATGTYLSGGIVDELFGVILGAVFIGVALISGGKLGMGDALAILVIGIYLGGSGSALVVLYAMMITAAFSIVLLIIRRGNRDTALPFMPFLLAGCVLQQIGAIA